MRKRRQSGLVHGGTVHVPQVLCRCQKMLLGEPRGLFQGLPQAGVVVLFYQGEQDLVCLASILGKAVCIGKARHGVLRLAFHSMDLSEIGPRRGTLRSQG